jgi:hypothetical protein
MHPFYQWVEIVHKVKLLLHPMAFVEFFLPKKNQVTIFYLFDSMLPILLKLPLLSYLFSSPKLYKLVYLLERFLLP